jgi:hypothetical protein
VESATKYVSRDVELTFILMSDNHNTITNNLILPSHINCKTKRIPSLGWPDATLQRHSLMLSGWEMVDSEIVGYLDADMRFIGCVEALDIVRPIRNSPAGVSLVRHPGYFNRSWIIERAIMTRLGPWECRPNSSAYVKWFDRKTYVCGGMYWGQSDAFFHMNVELEALIQQDVRRGMCAKHNDESYLNRWFLDHQELCSLEEPRWAYDPTYRHLSTVKPLIEAVRK